MLNKKMLLILIVIIIFFNGCIGTLLTIDTPNIYSATRLDIEAIQEDLGDIGDSKGSSMGIFILDLPFSIVFDTILLPYKIYISIAEVNKNNNQNKDELRSVVLFKNQKIKYI